ncbi:MAG: hypothetical protein MJZ43_04915 [Bacteroidaceae bacterium]|nr:hypothetical protein [Candidatus Equimonas faecalis]MCQ2206097.1 hypothetical protein [Bacteroidaceae bacterium]
METFLCDTLDYYCLNEQISKSFRYIVQMKDEVDGSCLRQALDLTLPRYPYLLKRIVATPEGYHLEPNDRPVVVVPSDVPLTLCGAEANYHLFGLTYAADCIFFNNVHAIFDGRGRGPVLHTLLYYYCKLRYNEEVDMPGVWLADTPIDPAEYFDPFTRPLPESDGMLPMTEVPAKALRLEEQGLVHRTQQHQHFVRINEKQLMSLCKSTDGTPNTILSLLMCRAIDGIHPDATEPIIGQVYCDYRSVVHAEKSHRNMVTTLPLVYDRSMRDMPLDRQNTIFRGKIIYESYPSVLLQRVAGIKGACEAINGLPTIEDKFAAVAQGMEGFFQQTTFAISYSGKKSFGSADRYITALYPAGEPIGIGILIEITAADGWFYITFMQDWREDVYFNAFLKQIVTLGIDFDLLYSSEAHCPRFSLK